MNLHSKSYKSFKRFMFVLSHELELQRLDMFMFWHDEGLLAPGFLVRMRSAVHHQLQWQLCLMSIGLIYPKQHLCL